MLLTLALVLYDFITDCLFASSQVGNMSIFVPAVLFLVAPILFNLGALLYVLAKAFRGNQEMERYLEENYALVAGTILISSTNIETFLLLTANFFYSPKFRAPLDRQLIRLLFLLGLIGNVLEDIPQLALQSYAAATEGFDTLLLLSVFASLLSLGFSLIKRAIFFLLYRFGTAMEMEPGSAELQLREKSTGFEKPELSKEKPEMFKEEKPEAPKDEKSAHLSF